MHLLVSSSSLGRWSVVRLTVGKMYISVGAVIHSHGVVSVEQACLVFFFFFLFRMSKLVSLHQHIYVHMDGV
jgi:hypothetical protein